MSADSCVIRRCSCQKPHKDGQYVVRFLYLSNGKEWPCRLCPHYSTLAAAIDGAKWKRSLRRFVVGGR